MGTANQEPLEKVLRQYDLKVNGIRNESYKDKKGVWWINSPDGYRILKKISNSELTLQHLIHAVKHLTQNGIFIPEILKTRDGKDYVNIEGTCFVLSKAVGGRTPNYSIPSELAMVVKELARFHRASKGFQPLAASKPKVHLGTWIEDYEKQLEDINSLYKKEQSTGGSTEAWKFILKEFPAFYERGGKAISYLKGSEYAEWVDKIRIAGCLCHQDFAAGNLIITPQGKLCVLDTDSITIDIPARDLRKLFNKVMKKNGRWESGLAKKITAFYQTENPLSISEWKVVKYDLTYPHLFIGAANKYCYKREKDWTEQKYLERLKETAAMEKSIIPILDSFEALLPI